MSESIYWVDSGGGALKLYDADAESLSPSVYYSIMGGVEALHMPEFTYSTDRIYTYDGDIVRDVNTNGRKLILPVLVKANTATEFLEKIRLLMYAMNPLRGAGKLKTYTADGKTRMMNCYLFDSPVKEAQDTGFFDGSSSMRRGPVQWRRFPITLYAPEPFWYDPLENEVYIDNVATMDLCHAATEEYGGPFSLYNSGDVNAWPIWSVDGPFIDNGTAGSVRIDNDTTGKHILVVYSLVEGSKIYIDTRPLTRSVTVNHATSIQSSMSIASRFFPLTPGNNTISVKTTGTSASTDVSLRVRWVDRYLGV